MYLVVWRRLTTPPPVVYMLSSLCIEKLEIIGSGSFGRVFKW